MKRALLYAAMPLATLAAAAVEAGFFDGNLLVSSLAIIL